jgi:hypothetical protein
MEDLTRLWLGHANKTITDLYAEQLTHLPQFCD